MIYAYEASPQIHQAITQGDAGRLKALIGSVLDVNVLNDALQTPLVAAADRGILDMEAVQLFVERGALLNAKDVRERNTAFYLSWHDDVDALRTLLAAGAEPAPKIKHREQAHERCMEILDKIGPINRVSEPPIESIKKELKIVRARRRQDVDRAVLEGADPNAVIAGRSLLVRAVIAKRGDVVSALIDAGADPDHQDYYGMTALIWACELGVFKAIDPLLLAGADPDIFSEKQETTALTTCLAHFANAYQRGNVAKAGDYKEAAVKIMGTGADLQKGSRYGMPLSIAHQSGDPEMIEEANFFANA